MAIWRRLGWVELTDAEENAAWHRFEAAFGHFGTGIREPVPSLTWNISGVYDGGEELLRWLEADLNAKALRSLTACTSLGESVYALDWQHPCFWFDPRGGVRSGDPDEWAVPVLPNGDHYVFLARDLRFGFIGHMDASVCVFGAPLLAELAADLPVAFTCLLRRDGQPVEK
ncbi:MAG: DUF2716 domain-containing protein [Planctomycetia bacterium]|nr:DUF2716 domain-containing protein [Planctomycetia bacterium]